MAEITEDDRVGLEEAWVAYCDALRDEGIAMVRGDHAEVDNPQELAEALRATARMGIAALQHRMDFNDPDFPVFFRPMDDRYKYGGPDANVGYLSAPIRGDATYRVRANHRNRELSVGTGEQEFWNERLEKDPDGSFEFVASAAEHPGNWHGIDPDVVSGAVVPENFPMAQSGGLFLRTYYWDPADTEPLGEFLIERVDEAAPLLPTPLSPERLGGQISSATELFQAMARWWPGRATNLRKENKPNVFGLKGHNPGGISAAAVQSFKARPMSFGVVAHELGPDEALVIDSKPPEAPYWSFQLYNAWWESPDLQHRQTSISHAHAHFDADGHFRCVLSHQDPGVPNWLDTGGSRRGFLCCRWIADDVAMPTAQVVPVGEVRSLLPAGHPVFSDADRRVQLRERRDWFARRYQR